MKLELRDALKRVFLIQFTVILLSAMFVGFEFTKPVTQTFVYQGVAITVRLPILLILFLAVTVMPLVEEILFRGPVWFAMRFRGSRNFIETSRWNFWLVIVVYGLSFGLAHYNYNFVNQLVITVIGMLWVWLVLEYRTIWPTIFLHYLSNIVLATIELIFSPHVHEALKDIVSFTY